MGQDDGNVPNTQVAWYDFDGIPLIYESRGLGEKAGIDNMDGFKGTTATGTKIHHPYKGDAYCNHFIFCENGYIEHNRVYDNNGVLIKRFDEPQPDPQRSFIQALKSGKKEDLKTDILEGHLSVTISHIGNISYQNGSQVSINDLRKTVGEYQYLNEVLSGFEEHLRLNGLNPEKEEIYLGPALCFDSQTERFTGEHAETANLFLKDSYREPFVIPENV